MTVDFKGLPRIGQAVDLNYLLDKSAHASPALHKFGEALLEPFTVSDIGQGVTPNPGTAEDVARGDHVHGFSGPFISYVSNVATSALTTTTTSTVIGGTTTPILTVTRPTAFALVVATFDMDIQAAGTGLVLGGVQQNFNNGGWAQYGQVAVYWAGAGNGRSTVAWHGMPTMGIGTIQWRLMGVKSAASGTAIIQATHTIISATLFQY